MTRPPRRVLVLGLNYAPEPTGIAPYTAALTRGLVCRDVKTEVLTTHPHYPDWKIAPGYGQWSRRDRVEGVDVVRLRHYVPRSPAGIRRAVSELSFGLRQAFTRWGSPDAIIAVSPALLSTWVAMMRSRLTHRSTPFVVWVQDLYGLGLKETRQGGGTAYRAIAAVESWVLRHATNVIVIHDRFAQRVTDDFGVPRERIKVVRNWTHIAPSPAPDTPAVRASLGWGENETVVLHAGNMGVKQGLENVVEAARLADQKSAPVRFVFLGGGTERKALQARAASVTRAQFIDALPDDAYAAAMQSADILLVNEKPGVSEMAVPSKLTSYFSSGRPVLAASDEHGITAEEIRTAGAGVVVPPDNPVALLDAALRLAADPVRARSLGANGLRYRHAVLSEDRALDRFTKILTAVIDKHETPGEQDLPADADPIEWSTPWPDAPSSPESLDRTAPTSQSSSSPKDTKYMV